MQNAAMHSTESEVETMRPTPNDLRRHMMFIWRGIRLLVPTAVAVLSIMPPSVEAQGPADLPEAPRPDSSASLTIGEAIRLALDSHPSIGAARAQREADAAGVREARAAWFPSLSVSGSVVQYEEPMVVTPIHGLTSGQTPPFDETLVQGVGTLGYTVWDGGARGARIDGARNRAAASDAAVEESRQIVLAEVVGAYLHVLGTDRVLDAHDRRVEALEAERDRVIRLREVGRAADVERLRVDAALASAEAERSRLRAELETAERGLARLVGLSPAETRVVRLRSPAPTADPVPERDSIVSLAGTGNPSLLRAREEREAASAGARIARSTRWPSVELAGQLFNRGSAGGGFQKEWSAGLQVSVPLFTGGATGSRIARAEAESDAAGEKARYAELQVEDAVDRAISAMEEADARVTSLDAAVEASAEVARIEGLRLGTGRGVQKDYLDAEATLLEARAGLARAEYARLTARVQAARVSGELTLAWIDEHLDTGGRPDHE